MSNTPTQCQIEISKPVVSWLMALTQTIAPKHVVADGYESRSREIGGVLVEVRPRGTAPIFFKDDVKIRTISRGPENT